MKGTKVFSILDVFNKIQHDEENLNTDFCVDLWNHLMSPGIGIAEVDENGIPREFEYSIKRLIQGLGSCRNSIRKSYFATLVSLLSTSDFSFGSVSLAYFINLVDERLSKFASKKEEGEVLSGRILAYGATMRSTIFTNGSVELQQTILCEMLLKSKDKSYLPLLVYTFIIDFIHTVDENFFESVVWPVLFNEVLVGWSSQTMETLYCILEVTEKYPTILNEKQISSTFETSAILHEKTIENVQKMLINITRESSLKHPLYETIGRCLSRNENDDKLLDKFWSLIEKTLVDSPTRLKILAAFMIFSVIVKHIQLSKIPDLLTQSFIEHIVNTCRPVGSRADELCIIGKKTLLLIVSKINEQTEIDKSSVVYNVLCKLMFESGQILIDKMTGVKLVFPLLSTLDIKQVKLLGKKCKGVIFLKFPPNEEKAFSQPRWNHKERCYAAQLLARLISHPQSDDLDWKIKYLKLMMRHALFIDDSTQINTGLASVLKTSFFTALSHQLSHLENHRMVLISLVFYIDNILAAGVHKLRVELSDEIMIQWRNAISRIYEIDVKISKTAKKKTVVHIFHTLFLQMALHLFIDPAVAKNILIELDRCYQEEKMQLNKCGEDDEGKEPKWAEIAVELFLSLLSHDTHLLRQLISRMFPYMCAHLTAQATFQILQVLDPSQNETILTEDNTFSDDESSSECESEEENEQTSLIQKEDLNEESDSEVEDFADMEQTTIETTRQAVRDALEIAGCVTDTESVDLDDIDEEEGRRLDTALAQAFVRAKKLRNNKNKQSTSDKVLMNFRVRVLDLVDIYLDNDPSLSLVLETIPVLFKLLEFAVKNNHQKPLENRIRSTIGKIGHLKKCNNIEAVDDDLLVNALKSLLDKGIRSTPVFLDLCDETNKCCIFFLRMHILRLCNEDYDSPSSFYSILVTSVENFFLKRDCLLSISMFENILKTTWTINLKLCERILELAFDPLVRGYRRNQGLSLLICFYRNTRLLSALELTHFTYLTALERKLLSYSSKALKSGNKVGGNLKPSFVSELFFLLYCAKTSKHCAEHKKWLKLSKIIHSFLCNGPSSSNTTRKYVIKLCSVLDINLKNEKAEKLNEKNEPNTGKNCGDGLVNGFTEESSCNIADPTTGNEQKADDNPSSSRNESLMEKRGKRKNYKSQEYKTAKRLRNELGNNAEVLKVQ